MTTRTFQIGPHIWFVLEYDGTGALYGLQEHDWREGGGLMKPSDISWEEFFIKQVRGRCVGEDFQDTAEREARAFLTSNEKVKRLI